MLHEAISPSRKMKILKIKIFFFWSCCSVSSRILPRYQDLLEYLVQWQVKMLVGWILPGGSAWTVFQVDK